MKENTPLLSFLRSAVTIVLGAQAGASLIMAAVVGLKMNKCSRFSLGAPSLLEESDIHILNPCKLYKGELQIKYYGSMRQKFYLKGI